MAHTVSTREVVKRIAADCNAFVERFMTEHCRELEGLPSPRVQDNEQKLEWYDLFRKFTEEAELRLLNAVTMWGVMQPLSFDKDFIEATQGCNELDQFLAMTEYPTFIRRIYAQLQTEHERDAKLAEDKANAALHAKVEAEKKTGCRLSEIDRRLAELDQERNALLMERRHLAGCPVQPLLAAALKREIDVQRYKEDVGLD